MSDWTPSAWRERPASQQPTYPDRERLDEAVEELAGLPPLVTSWEVERLKSQLAEAAEGRRFMLQGGACAERFDQCSAEVITNKLKVLLQMSLVLTYGLRRRIIRVGRFAGQYAKPRSSDTETRDGVTLPAYRGDLVNGPGFTARCTWEVGVVASHWGHLHRRTDSFVADLVVEPVDGRWMISGMERRR